MTSSRTRRTTRNAAQPAADTPEQEDSGPSRFTVSYKGKVDTYDLVMSGITFGEARAFEKVAGVTFVQIMSNPELRAELGVLQALLWVSMKRRHPTMAFSELDDVAIDSVDWPDAAPPPDQTANDEEAPGPTSGADEGPSTAVA